MLKRRIIAFFLAFTYSLVLAHSIIPHHHHEPAAGHRNHHEVIGHKHGLSAVQQQENTIVHLLSHFPHNQNGSDFAVCQISNSSVLVKKNTDVQVFLLPAFHVQLPQLLTLHCTHYTPYLPHIPCYPGTSSSLRAPPFPLS